MLTEARSVERKNEVGDGLSFLERRSRAAADCCWLFQDPGSENYALNSSSAQQLTWAKIVKPSD